MRPRTAALALAALLAAGVLVLLATRGEDDVGHAPPSPTALSSPEQTADSAGPPAPFFPSPLPIAVPPEALAAAPDTPEPAGLTPRQRLARAALGQFGPRLRELGDVTAYLSGGDLPPWHLVPVDAQTRDELLARLSSEDPRVRFEAAVALCAAELGPRDLARLRNRFDAERAGLADRAGKDRTLVLAFALAVHGDRHGLAGLADALRSGEGSNVKDFRNGAALVLALTDDRESAPLLRDLLATDPDRLVRKHAAVGLGRIGGEANQSALHEALVREPDMEVRAWSALAAGRAGEEKAGDEALRQALAADPAGEVRGAAAFALSRIGGEGTEEALVETFFSDGHPFARIGAVAGVARRDDDGSSSEFLTGQGTPYLAGLVRGADDAGARFYAVAALTFVPPTDESRSALRDAAANEKNGWIRSAAIGAVGETEGEAALPWFRELLEKEPPGRMRDRLEAEVRRLESG